MFTRSKSAEQASALMQQLRDQAGARSRLFAVPDGVGAALPERGLRPGSAYTLDAPGALLLALLTEPSREGVWCGVVGIPELGAEAAQEAGVSLERLVLVPDPGYRWLSVVAALAEVLGVIAVRPAGAVSPAEASRLAARLRDRESTLLVVGPWPRAEAALRMEGASWSGVGAGHGHLQEREAILSVTSKRYPMPRTARLLLPGPDGRVGALPSHAPAEISEFPPLKAVG